MFHRDSYGYRPGKSAIEAVASTRKRCWDYYRVIVFDVRGLFYNIDHSNMVQLVRKYTDIPWIILDVESWLTPPKMMPGGSIKERHPNNPF